MAQKSGFFNTEYLADGTPDRKYDADTYSDWLAAWIRDGVRRSGLDDYKVSAAGGFAIKINQGYAIVGGKWTHNDSEHTAFSVPTPPVGDRSRIDRIVLRRDNSIAVRDAFLYYKQGAEATSPQPPALERSGSIHEIAIADIRVRPGASSITQADITDQRGNGAYKYTSMGEDEQGHPIFKVEEGDDLCGWVTTPVGYDEYFSALDTEFHDWLGPIKDELASKTMYRKYRQRITAQSQTSAITFSIAQYDPTGVDVVEVHVNGLLAMEGPDYTLSGSTITFTSPKVAGTEIDVTVNKSIDGTGLGSVADEVDELQEELSTVKNIGEYIYICNGLDDNVKLSQIAEQFFQSGAESDQLTINVYGTFGAQAPYAGTGASTSRYRWFVLGSEAATSTKRVIIDFLNCSAISLNGTGESHYIVFYGSNCTIRNATVIARQRGSSSGGSLIVFEDAGSGFMAENCRFDVSSYYGGMIAKQGTFRDCYGTVTSSRDNAFCFGISGGLLRVFGGTYTAYTGLTSTKSAVFGENGTAGGAVVATGVNCPTVTKTSHYQTNAAYFASTATRGVLSGTVTTLSVATAVGGGVTVRDTVAASFPNVIY